MRGVAVALALGAIVLACSSPPPPADPGPSHPGEAWWSWRAQQLGTTPAAARARDAALSTTEPPHEIWDAETRREAAALWRDLCVSCHGPRGRLEGVPPPPEGQTPARSLSSFGLEMGFLLAGDTMRAATYRRIAHATDSQGNATDMPAYGEMLSREQIWALVFFVEDL